MCRIIDDLMGEIFVFSNRLREGLSIRDSAAIEFFQHLQSELDILNAKIKKLENESKTVARNGDCGVQQKTRCAFEWLIALRTKFGDRESLLYLGRFVFKLKFATLERIFKIDKSFISRKTRDVSSELPRFLKNLSLEKTVER